MARAANWMYSNHNRRTGEAREIVSSPGPQTPAPQPPSRFSDRTVDCSANPPTPVCPFCRPPFEGDAAATPSPSQWKSNNRETSFRKATISTPIEQTRFLLVIKPAPSALSCTTVHPCFSVPSATPTCSLLEITTTKELERAPRSYHLHLPIVTHMQNRH